MAELQAAEDIVIRTMRDDLADAQKPVQPKRQAPNVPVSPIPPKPTPPMPAPVPSVPRSTQPPVLPKPQPVVTPQLPLPARAPAPGSNKVVVLPRASGRGFRGIKKWIFVSLGCAVLLGAVGSAIWGWWSGRITIPSTLTTPTPDITAGRADIIPRSALVVVRYDLTSSQHRAIILGAWNETERPLSMTGLLTGDPRLLLADSELQEAYYVLLEGDAQPYVVIPHTAEGQKLFTASPEAHVLSHQGWYIAHSQNTQRYQEALAGGSIASDADLARGFVNTVQATPLRFLISTHALNGLREQLVGQGLGGGQLSGFVVDAALTGTGFALQFGGEAPLPLLIESPELTDTRLLEMVPGDVRSLRLGANFQEDLHYWQAGAKILDTAVLNRPTVVDLIRNLSGPYAFYSRSGEDGRDDLGLIIPLPASQAATTLGDPTLEDALFALAPLHLPGQDVAQLAFTDRVYNETAVRYVNLDTHLKALDYAIKDGYLLIATSREGMFRLLDTIDGAAPSALSAHTWQPLLAEWNKLPLAHDYASGVLSYAPLRSLLPTKTVDDPLLMGLVVQPERELVSLKGLVVLTTPAAR